MKDASLLHLLLDPNLSLACTFSGAVSPKYKTKEMQFILLGFFSDYFVGFYTSSAILQKLFRNIFSSLNVESFLQKGKKDNL